MTSLAVREQSLDGENQKAHFGDDKSENYFNRGRLSEEQDALMAAVLQETRIQIKRNEDCRRDTKRLVQFNPASMICGYEYSKDACQVSSIAIALKSF